MRYRIWDLREIPAQLLNPHPEESASRNRAEQEPKQSDDELELTRNFSAHLRCTHLLQQNEDGYEMGEICRDSKDIHDGGGEFLLLFFCFLIFL